MSEPKESGKVTLRRILKEIEEDEGLDSTVRDRAKEEATRIPKKKG